MLSTQQLATLNAANCEVAFDNLTRQLYATDASPYQIVPQAVAFPENAREASAHHPGGVAGGHLGDSARRRHGAFRRRHRRRAGR